jgi:hypothetical protein
VFLPFSININSPHNIPEFDTRVVDEEKKVPCYYHGHAVDEICSRVAQKENPEKVTDGGDSGWWIH